MRQRLVTPKSVSLPKKRSLRVLMRVIDMASDYVPTPDASILHFSSEKPILTAVVARDSILWSIKYGVDMYVECVAQPNLC